MIQLQVITVVMMVCASGIRKDERKKGRRRIHSFEREKAVVVAIEVPWYGQTCIRHEEVLNPSPLEKVAIASIGNGVHTVAYGGNCSAVVHFQVLESHVCVLLIFQAGMLSVRFLQRCLGL